MATTKERAVWTGGVQIGLMNLPIRLHTAIKEHSTSFNMITPTHTKPNIDICDEQKCEHLLRCWTGHDEGSIITDLEPTTFAHNCKIQNEKGTPCQDFVGYDTKCKGCGKPVSRAGTKKGYKVGDTVVIISPTELEQLLPKSTKTISIKGFTTAGKLDWLFSNKPFFTSPNLDPKKGGSPIALKVYQVIRQQLELKDMVAFGSYVKLGKEHPIVLRPYQGRLVLQQLYFADEVKNPPEIEPCEITERERELVGLLVEKLSKPFDLSEFVDAYQQKVNELITARAMGKEEAPILEKPTKPTDDFVKALEATVEAVA